MPVEEKIVKLSQLPPYGTAEVAFIKECTIKRRLSGLGINEGTQLIRLFSASGGDPTAYSVRGTVVALRKSDAENIMVRGVDKWV